MPDTVDIRGPNQLACLNLRGEPTEPFRHDAATALGVDLPVVPCTHSRVEDRTIYWLGPNEWLVTAPAGTEGALQDALRATLTGHFTITDVSGAWLSFSLSGETAVEVLSKSSPCDFHPRAFPSGRCVQTTFAKAAALIARHADNFEVLARTSYGTYLSRWLAEAGREYAPNT